MPNPEETFTKVLEKSVFAKARDKMKQGVKLQSGASHLLADIEGLLHGLADEERVVEGLEEDGAQGRGRAGEEDRDRERFNRSV